MKRGFVPRGGLGNRNLKCKRYIHGNYFEENVWHLFCLIVASDVLHRKEIGYSLPVGSFLVVECVCPVFCTSFSTIGFFHMQ